MKQVTDQEGFKVQVFTLVSGQCNLTSGATEYECSSAVCTGDGDLYLVDYAEAISFLQGEVLGWDFQNVTITSGTFHLA